MAVVGLVKMASRVVYTDGDFQSRLWSFTFPLQKRSPFTWRYNDKVVGLKVFPRQPGDDNDNVTDNEAQEGWKGCP